MVYIGINLITLRVVVDGLSMEDTLHSGELLLVNRIHYKLSEPPHRGDIIVFHSPAMSDENIIKRIIGLPEDTVEFREGVIYINGYEWDEAYLSQPCSITTCPNSIWQLGSGEYFVMGDNRNASRDSRSLGTISKEAIIGKAIMRYWPIATFRWL